MGIITLALIANGNISANNFHVPDLGRRPSATAIALGTYVGRLAHHPHPRDAHHQDGPGPGLCGAERGRDSDPRLLALRLSALDDPHDLGRVMGAGAAKRLSAVRWGWPATSSPRGCSRCRRRARSAALAYGLTRIFGTGALGPIVVSMLAIGLIAAIFGAAACGRLRRRRAGDRRVGAVIAGDRGDWKALGTWLSSSFADGRRRDRRRSRSRSRRRPASPTCGASSTARPRRSPSRCWRAPVLRSPRARWCSASS